MVAATSTSKPKSVSSCQSGPRRQPPYPEEVYERKVVEVVSDDASIAHRKRSMLLRRDGQYEALRYYLDKLTQNIVYECELAGLHLAAELIRQNPSALTPFHISLDNEATIEALTIVTPLYARASAEHNPYSEPSASRGDLHGGPQKSTYTG